MLDLLDKLVTAVWIFDIDRYRICWANPAALALWKADSNDELYERDFLLEATPAVRQTLLSYQPLFEKGESLRQFWILKPKGTPLEIFAQFSGYRLDDGRMAMLVEALPSNALKRDVESVSTTTISSFDLSSERYLSGNMGFIKKMGAQVKKLSDIFVSQSAFNKFIEGLTNFGEYSSDVLLISASGENWFSIDARIVESEQPGEHTILIQQHDIHSRKINELALKSESLKDHLTGLLNRKGLSDKIATTAQRKSALLFYYVDLDGFKLINDTFGHSVGDQLLLAFSKRLAGYLDGAGVAARIGGDEFIWFVEVDKLPNTIGKSNRRASDNDSLGHRIGVKLVTYLSRSYRSDLEIPIMIAASVGGSTAPADGSNIDALLMAADTAMYQAKQQGRKRCVMYDESMKAKVARQNQLVQCLHHAIASDELTVYYQPVLDMETGKTVSFEALLRWNNPELGWVMPFEAIQVAEDMGFIGELENWVINQALKDLIRLRKLYKNSTLRMAVNLSGIHLNDKTLVPYIDKTLTAYSLSPEDLIVELTESVLVKNIENGTNPIQELVALGVKISIDDFGTGYSSLSYLHTVPAHTVKIDRSFVEQACENSKLIVCVYDLIRSLNMVPLIEGVESEEQNKLFNQIGITMHQGYFHGRPEPMSYYQNRDDNI